MSNPRQLFITLAAILGCALLPAAVLQASDTPVKLSELPAAVRKAIQKETVGAKIKGFNKEVENGMTEWEAETTVNGHARDLAFDSSGKLLSVEEEVGLTTLPAPAKAAIEKKAAGGKITKVEKVTVDSTKVTWEAAITVGGKKSEFSVKPDGSPVK